MLVPTPPQVWMTQPVVFALQPSLRPLLISLLFLVLASLTSATPSLAQNTIAVSPDITIAVSTGAGLIVADEDVIIDNQLGLVILENLGALPSAGEVVAFGLDVNGDRLLAFETTIELAGGVVARKGDVVRFDGTAYSVEFDASMAGVPSSASVDAVSLSANGLLLSFDTTIALPGGLVAADEDLVEWDGTSFALLFDGSSEGVDRALDIDAAQAAGLGQYLVSFDTNGTVGGVVFSDEDVLRFDGMNWSLEFDLSALDPAWPAADLEAVMVPEPGISLGLLAGAGALMTAARRRSWKLNRPGFAGGSRD